jgi:hypothetical protein
MKNRVRIGTCSGPAEATFVRSVFDAHELPVLISGEMHAYAMGGLGGFIRLEIFVDSEDEEEAVALLRDIRAGEHAVSESDALADDAGSDGDLDGDARADAEGVWIARREADPGSPQATSATAPELSPTSSFDMRRRRTGVVLLLSVLAGFGTAHMSTGAWGRGSALAALHLLGIVLVGRGDLALGGWLMFAVRFADLFGALWRVWSQPRRAATQPDGSLTAA